MKPNLQISRRAGATKVLAGAGILFLAAICSGQTYDLLLKGGHLIDPRNQIDAPRDVAIAGGRVAAVAPAIPASTAKEVIDVGGLYVAPGFIDLHGHVFDRGNANSVWGDGWMLPYGVTTVVEAGGTGWRDFEHFKETAIKGARVRVLLFLNIHGAVYQHVIVPGRRAAPQRVEELDPKAAVECIERNRDIIVGIKTRHWRAPTWDSVDRALEAGRLANVPVMVDFGTFFPQRPFEELVGRKLRPGDIYTHTYLHAVPMLDEHGRLRPYLLEAQRRGVIFDAGHGQGSFAYAQAVPAMRAGFWPNTISTDVHRGSAVRGMKNMNNVMSKFLNLGLSLPEVIARVTWAPAQVIRRTELGHLSVGAGADVAVFGVRSGEFGFVDIEGVRMSGDRKIEGELTLRDGTVVWDLNGLSAEPWEEPTSNPPNR